MDDYRFCNEYEMNRDLYWRWTCPPPVQRKGFWLWLIIGLAAGVGCALSVYFGLHNRIQTTLALLALAGFYRSLLYRPMLAKRQFDLMCRQLDKAETRCWRYRYEIGDQGIRTYIDGEQRSPLGWEQIQRVNIGDHYLDLETERALLHLEEDAYTKGSAAELRAWLEVYHPELEQQRLEKR